MASYVYVGNLASSTQEDAVRQAFVAAGCVVRSVSILKSPQNDRSRGFGFVEVESENDIPIVIQTMNGVELDGQKLAVDRVKERVQRSRNDGRSFESYSGLGGRLSSGPRRPGGAGARRKKR